MNTIENLSRPIPKEANPIEPISKGYEIDDDGWMLIQAGESFGDHNSTNKTHENQIEFYINPEEFSLPLEGTKQYEHLTKHLSSYNRQTPKSEKELPEFLYRLLTKNGTITMEFNAIQALFTRTPQQYELFLDEIISAQKNENSLRKIAKEKGQTHEEKWYLPENPSSCCDFTHPDETEGSAHFHTDFQHNNKGEILTTLALLGEKRSIKTLEALVQSFTDNNIPDDIQNLRTFKGNELILSLSEAILERRKQEPTEKITYNWDQRYKELSSQILLSSSGETIPQDIQKKIDKFLSNSFTGWQRFDKSMSQDAEKINKEQSELMQTILREKRQQLPVLSYDEVSITLQKLHDTPFSKEEEQAFLKKIDSATSNRSAFTHTEITSLLAHEMEILTRPKDSEITQLDEKILKIASALHENGYYFVNFQSALGTHPEGYHGEIKNGAMVLCNDHTEIQDSQLEEISESVQQTLRELTLRQQPEFQQQNTIIAVHDIPILQGVIPSQQSPFEDTSETSRSHSLVSLEHSERKSVSLPQKHKQAAKTVLQPMVIHPKKEYTFEVLPKPTPPHNSPEKKKKTTTPRNHDKEIKFFATRKNTFQTSGLTEEIKIKHFQTDIAYAPSDTASFYHSVSTPREITSARKIISVARAIPIAYETTETGKPDSIHYASPQGEKQRAKRVIKIQSPSFKAQTSNENPEKDLSPAERIVSKKIITEITEHSFPRLKNNSDKFSAHQEEAISFIQTGNTPLRPATLNLISSQKDTSAVTINHPSKASSTDKLTGSSTKPNKPRPKTLNDRQESTIPAVKQEHIKDVSIGETLASALKKAEEKQTEREQITVPFGSAQEKQQTQASPKSEKNESSHTKQITYTNEDGEKERTHTVQTASGPKTVVEKGRSHMIRTVQKQVQKQTEEEISTVEESAKETGTNESASVTHSASKTRKTNVTKSHEITSQKNQQIAVRTQTQGQSLGLALPTEKGIPQDPYNAKLMFLEAYRNAFLAH